MAFTYTLAKVPTEALHWLRYKLGATKADASPLVDDAEIEGVLVPYGLTPTSPPTGANLIPLLRAGASLARSIAAAFARQGGVVVPQVGTPKNATADIFLRLAESLEAEAIALEETASETQAAADGAPFEIVDNVDYRRDRFGEDQSEYVGDEVS